MPCIDCCKLTADTEHEQAQRRAWHAVANEMIHIANNLTVGARVESRLQIAPGCTIIVIAERKVLTP